MASESTSTRRVVGVDVARALAALIMIQGHATDAWVAESHQNGAFRISRFLGTFPLPAFLLLAGVSVALRVDLGARRGEALDGLRRRLLRRGLGLVGTGYAVSALSALVDGGGLPAALRADVLQVIGLSIALAALLLRGRRDVARVLSVGVALTLLCPFVPALELPLHAAAFVGLFVDAAPITRMPLVPLFAWFAWGYALGVSLSRRPRPWAIGAVGLVLALVGNALSVWALARVPGAFDRRHIAVVFNVLDLAGRGMCVLSLGLLVGKRLHGRVQGWFVRFGTGSLIAYVVHIPFCYGALSQPFSKNLNMAHAALGVVALVGLCDMAVRVHKAWKARRRPMRASTS